jgi:hypothetical protein
VSGDERSTRAEVRNPVLLLPSMAAIGALDETSRRALSDLLRDLHRDATERADKCWRTHKAPMAAYWKAVAVYAGHTSRAIRKAAPMPSPSARPCLGAINALEENRDDRRQTSLFATEASLVSTDTRSEAERFTRPERAAA